MVLFFLPLPLLAWAICISLDLCVLCCMKVSNVSLPSLISLEFFHNKDFAVVQLLVAVTGLFKRKYNFLQ